jgi:DNA transposition AAA+ family ATPase
MVTQAPSAPTITKTLDVGSIPVAGTAGRNYKFAGDIVANNIKDLDPDDRALVWWLHLYCFRMDFTRDERGRLLKKPDGDYYSVDSVDSLFSGGRIRRGENIKPILAAIAAVKKIEDRRDDLIVSGFIRTRMYSEIERRCDRARLRQRILFIFGESQIGKTAALEEYQRTHNHGATIMVECPTGGVLGKFLQALAANLNIMHYGNDAQLAERIINTIDNRMLLICDEMHRCLRKGTTAGIEVFSFLRELWNRKKCGIVISMTNEGRDVFRTGPHAKALEQIWRRRITPLQLPNFPPDDDAALFAAAYGLPAATMDEITISVSYVDEKGKQGTSKHTAAPLQLQREQLAAEGLGVWISILQDASDMAKEKSKAITWGAVIKAHCQAQAESQILE